MVFYYLSNGMCVEYEPNVHSSWMIMNIYIYYYTTSVVSPPVVIYMGRDKYESMYDINQSFLSSIVWYIF